MNLLAALILCAAARVEEPEKPEATPAAAVTMAELPPIAGGSHYGSPNSLPPVTAQLFHIGGLYELQPMFLFSVGDPFWRTLGFGLRVERHFDERWSIAVHARSTASCRSSASARCTSTPT